MRTELLCAACICLLANIAAVLGTDPYQTAMLPLSQRLFRVSVSTMCFEDKLSKWLSTQRFPFPRSIDANVGPLKVSPPGVKIEATVFRSNGSYPPEWAPNVKGLVVADASDGSLTVAFANGKENVWINSLKVPHKAEETEFCETASPSTSAGTVSPSHSGTVVKEHTSGLCVKCHINHGFKLAWKSVKDVVFKIVNNYTAAGYTGAIFVTGHGLGGAIASECGLQMRVKFKARAAATYTYGAPMFGQKDCQDAINKAGMNLFRVTHISDPFMVLPATKDPMTFENVGKGVFFKCDKAPQKCSWDEQYSKSESQKVFDDYLANKSPLQKFNWIAQHLCLGQHMVRNYGDADSVCPGSGGMSPAASNCDSQASTSGTKAKKPPKYPRPSAVQPGIAVPALV